MHFSSLPVFNLFSKYLPISSHFKSSPNIDFTRSREHVVSHSFFSPATTGTNPFVTTASGRSSSQSADSGYNTRGRGHQHAKNITQHDISTASTISLPLLDKFSEGLDQYESHRVNSRLLPNYYIHMNPSPNAIPANLLIRGINTPHKVRMHILDTAERYMHRAKKVAGIDYTKLIPETNNLLFTV